MSLEESPGGPDQLRRVTDPRVLRALAHPVRLALVEVLSLDGPLTATELGERIGESPTTCSFHLRQLAKYDFVEEAGGGKGRARPWKMTRIGMQLPSSDDDPETEIAANVLVRLLRERERERYETWLANRASFSPRWRAAADHSQYVFYLTVEELEDLNEEIGALLLPRFRERLTDRSARPADALPVEMLLMNYPIAAPPRAD